MSQQTVSVTVITITNVCKIKNSAYFLEMNAIQTDEYSFLNSLMICKTVGPMDFKVLLINACIRLPG